MSKHRGKVSWFWTEISSNFYFLLYVEKSFFGSLLWERHIYVYSWVSLTTFRPPFHFLIFPEGVFGGKIWRRIKVTRFFSVNRSFRKFCVLLSILQKKLIYIANASNAIWYDQALISSYSDQTLACNYKPNLWNSKLNFVVVTPPPPAV